MTVVAFPDSGKDGKRYKLTAKQEAFVQAYLYGPEHIRGNQSAAYRTAYNTEKYTAQSVWVNACNQMRNVKVMRRIEEEKKRMAEEQGLTPGHIVAELEEARELARAERQPGAAVAASMGKAKLLGFITEKVQQDTTIVDHREHKPAQFNDALDKAKKSGT